MRCSTRPAVASAARKAAEATARYLLSVADETTLGTFEEELVECIRALLAALPAEGESAHREERVQTKIDAAVADLGNVIYNIETGEIREAMEQAREIRESLATIAEEKP